MKRWVVGVLVAAMAVTAVAQSASPSAAARAYDDAKVIERVAEVAKRDLPRELLGRIVAEDIDLLRGKRADGTYEYASYERLEAGRISDEFSVQANDDPEKLSKLELSGEFVYRLIIESPSRRLLVTKNRRIYVDRVEIEAIAVGRSERKVQTVKIESWLEPGSVKPIDLDDIARQATARVYARGNKETGYGNLVLTLVQAKIVDQPDSPYASAVSTAKSLQRALRDQDPKAIRTLASRMRDGLPQQPVMAQVQPIPAARTIEVSAPRASSLEPTPTLEIYLELQAVEDLMTGSETEKREGLDKLHQLVRRLRPR